MSRHFRVTDARNVVDSANGEFSPGCTSCPSHGRGRYFQALYPALGSRNSTTRIRTDLVPSFGIGCYAVVFPIKGLPRRKLQRGTVGLAPSTSLVCSALELFMPPHHKSIPEKPPQPSAPFLKPSELICWGLPPVSFRFISTALIRRDHAVRSRNWLTVPESGLKPSRALISNDMSKRPRMQ